MDNFVASKLEISHHFILLNKKFHLAGRKMTVYAFFLMTIFFNLHENTEAPCQVKCDKIESGTRIKNVVQTILPTSNTQ